MKKAYFDCDDIHNLLIYITGQTYSKYTYIAYVFNIMYIVYCIYILYTYYRYYSASSTCSFSCNIKCTCIDKYSTKLYIYVSYTHVRQYWVERWISYTADAMG